MAPPVHPKRGWPPKSYRPSTCRRYAASRNGLRWAVILSPPPPPHIRDPCSMPLRGDDNIYSRQPPVKISHRHLMQMGRGATALLWAWLAVATLTGGACAARYAASLRVEFDLIRVVIPGVLP